ncbi:MAG: type II toxin-antitoxin system RelE family toxin [Thermoplasmatota archaeon]
MTWNYSYQPAFLADLKRLDLKIAQRILDKLDAIKDDALRTMKRLKGSDLFSLRVGDHRVYARAYVAQKSLEFVRAGHRRNVHDR